MFHVLLSTSQNDLVMIVELGDDYVDIPVFIFTKLLNPYVIDPVYPEHIKLFVRFSRKH